MWKTSIWEPYFFRDKLFGISENSNVGIIQDKSIIKNKIFNWIRGNFFIY